MNIFTWSSIITSILSFIFGAFTYSKNKKALINKIWFGVSLSISLWSLALFGVVVSNDPKIALCWQYLLDASGIFVPILFFNFVLVLLNFNKNKNKFYKINLIVAYLTSFIIVLLSFTPLFKKGVTPILEFNYWINPGPFYFTFPLVFIFFVLYSVILLFNGYFSAVGTKKMQIRYVLIASIIGFTGGATNFLPQLMNTYPVGNFFVVFYVLFIAYAVTRYRLMDIRLIIIRSLVFSLIVFVAASIFSVISTLIAYLFTDMAGIRSSVVSSVVVVILLTIFYQSLRNLIEKTTNTFLYKRSYDPDALLAEITTVTSSILDLHHLLASICTTLANAFHSQSIGIALLNSQTKKLEVTYKEGFKEGVAESLVNYPNVVSILFEEVKNLKGILVIDEMKTKYENGEFKPLSPELLLALYNNDIAIILPLYVKEQMIGIVALGNKKSGDPYNHQDLNILKIVGGQSAIAIENARLYDELKDFNVKLEEEVRRKTTQLRKANDELRQLDQAKSEFISIASHQLRTPLTVIKGYISMMREGSFGKVPPVIMTNLEKVYASNERLIGLVENLLDISRIESGRQAFDWKKIRLEDIAQTVVDNLKTTAKTKDLKLFFHKPKNPTPELVADPNKIHEVMMNFVDNAIKYTEKGEINVFIMPDSKSNLVTFYVKDTGRGVDPATKPFLFRKFSRGKGSFRVHTEGVGLGLYVAKMIIDNHKGKIWVESAGSNKGSKFCFSLSTKTTIKDLENGKPEKKFGETVPSKPVNSAGQ